LLKSSGRADWKHTTRIFCFFSLRQKHTHIRQTYRHTRTKTQHAQSLFLSCFPVLFCSLSLFFQYFLMPTCASCFLLILLLCCPLSFNSIQSLTKGTFFLFPFSFVYFVCVSLSFALFFMTNCAPQKGKQGGKAVCVCVLCPLVRVSHFFVCVACPRGHTACPRHIHSHLHSCHTLTHPFPLSLPLVSTQTQIKFYWY
jgi:hypothetical protein